MRNLVGKGPDREKENWVFPVELLAVLASVQVGLALNFSHGIFSVVLGLKRKKTLGD